jgi:hypothetical protein
MTSYVRPFIAWRAKNRRYQVIFFNDGTTNLCARASTPAMVVFARVSGSIIAAAEKMNFYSGYIMSIVNQELLALMRGLLHEMSLQNTKHHLQADVYNDRICLRIINTGIASGSGPRQCRYHISVSTETADKLVFHQQTFTAAECEAAYANRIYDYKEMINKGEYMWML